MRKAIVALLLACFPLACVLQTETVEGDAGPQGPKGDPGQDGGPGPPGEPGVSPFSYVDQAAKTDIYYNGGDVGIGTSAPEALLEISSATKDAAQIHISQTNTVGGEQGGIVWRGYYNGTTTLFGAAAIKRINLEDNNSAANMQRLGFFLRDPVADGALIERMSIRENGNVGIGTTTPSDPLEVSRRMTVRGTTDEARINLRGNSGLGANAGYSATLYMYDANAATQNNEIAFIRAGLVNDASTGMFEVSTKKGGAWVPGIYVENGNVGIGTTNPALRLTVNGTAGNPSGAWTMSSDIRLKQSVAPLPAPLARLLRLRGVTYEWREPEKHGNFHGPQVGMIAQEVEQIFPEWVGTDADGYKTLTYRGFEALVVEGLRELKLENDQLRGANTALAAESAARAVEVGRELASLKNRLSAIEKREGSQHASIMDDRRWPIGIAFGAVLCIAPADSEAARGRNHVLHGVVDLVLQFGAVPWAGAGEEVVLGVTPDPLVGVELRCVGAEDELEAAVAASRFARGCAGRRSQTKVTGGGCERRDERSRRGERTEGDAVRDRRDGDGGEGGAGGTPGSLPSAPTSYGRRAE